MNRAIQAALLRLDPTGEGGFEGMVRDALVEVTGQSFGLLKSGPQGGIDGLSASIANRLIVGFEGKRYSNKSSLGLDGLKAKLLDAARSQPSLDLWILATSRTIAINDAQALELVGEDVGVDVLILDAGSGAVLPGIAVLLAQAPACVERHFPGDPRLFAALAEIRDDPGFASQAAALRDRLSQADIGLAAARRRCGAHWRERMRDLAAARHAFDSHAALCADDVRRIARPKLDRELEGWWDAGANQPLVLLGREGVGKTWEALGWWLRKDDVDDAAPLTLVVPARDVGNADGPALLASALATATGVRDAAFWQRRLRRWTTIPCEHPFILLVVDGLNQKPSYSAWDDLVLSLTTPEWRERVAIAMTCRPDHWSNRLGQLPGLPDGACTIEVGPFDDAELDALLALYELSRADFDEPLLDALRVPRLFPIALARRADLRDSGDITAERLVYEDWRHRRPQARKIMDHAAFRAFVARLGRAARCNLDTTTLSRAELLSRLSADDVRDTHAIEQVLSELVDGSWLTESGSTHRFRLDPARVPAALGLTMVDDLRQEGNAAHVEQRLAELLDPLQGMDLSVAILRHAVTFALLDPDLDREATGLLLRHWLAAQNFGRTDFAAFWRLIGCDTELVLDIAEREWFEALGGRFDEVLDKGIGNAFKWPEVAGPVISRLRRWFSWYWLDPLQGEVIGRIPDDAAAERRRQATRDRAVEAVVDPAAALFGVTLEEVPHAHRAWGQARAMELLSWLPRLPLLDVYTCWAFGRAVMGGVRRDEHMHWNLRWYSELEHSGDAANAVPAFIDRAARLLESGGSTGRKAARILLSGIATADAEACVEAAFGAPQARPSRAPSWPAPEDSDRFADKPFAAVFSLCADPTDPDCDLPDALVARLEEVADAAKDAHIRADARTDDGGFAHATPPLARWAPVKLAALIDRRYRIVAVMPAKPAGWFSRLILFLRGGNPPAPPEPLPAAKNIVAEMLALKPETRETWRKQLAMPGVLAAYEEAYILALIGASPSEQIRILGGLSHDTKLPRWLSPVLARPDSQELDELALRLEPSSDPSAIVFWLRYLSVLGERGWPAGWIVLKRLVAHPDSKVRAAVFELVAGREDRTLADAIVASGWRADDTMGRDEQANGSLALLCSSAAEAGEAARLVHGNALGELAHRYPDRHNYADAFADHLRDELHLLRTAKSRTHPHSLLWVHRGWDQLLARHESEFREWVEPFLDGVNFSSFHMFGMSEQFPLIGALKAYERLEPGTRARMLEGSLQNKDSGIRLGNLYREATEIVGPEGERVRELALEEANNDQKLFDFAFGLQRNAQTGWLIERIRGDFQASTAATAARAITLAGFLASSAEADALWSELNARVPTAGWLADVRVRSLKTYRLAQRNLHWRARFLQSDDPAIAFAAFELFVRTVDHRLLLDREVWGSALDACTLDWRLHWNANAPRINSAVESSAKELAKTFLSSELPLSGQAPRAH